MDSKSQLVDGNTTNNSDQQITDFPLEEIMKEYLCKEDFQRFVNYAILLYTSLVFELFKCFFALSCLKLLFLFPYSFYADAFDIEPLGLGLTDLVPDDVNVSEVNTDFLVPDSLFLDEICQKHDNTEPEEQLYSLLEEYIKEEEDKREGRVQDEAGSSLHFGQFRNEKFRLYSFLKQFLHFT